MNGPRVGSKDFLDERGIKAWAGVPMEVIERAMARDQCLDSRLRHAMILWSWCGPDATEAVVRKDARGYIVRDGAGRPIPAQFKDLVALLGLGPGMKANVSRIAQGMIAQDLLRIEGRVLYLVFKPAAFEPGQSVGSTGNWTIAGVVVSTANLPEDPIERADAIRFLEVVGTGWKDELRVVKTRYRELLRQGLSARGILIEKSKKSLREEKNERTDDSAGIAEAPAPASEPVRPFVPSLSQAIAQRLRTALSSRFSLPTVLDAEVLAKIAAHVPDEEGLQRFERQLDGQKPQFDRWPYLIAIAKACNEARETEKAAEKAALAANGGVCPHCNGAGLVHRVFRGIAAVERCVCQQAASSTTG